MGGVAPIARLVLAFTLGTAAGLAGAPQWTAPLVVLLGLLAPIRTSRRPVGRPWLMLAAASGLVGGSATLRPHAGCPPPVAGVAVTLEGRFLASPRAGSAPFRPDDGCADVTVVVSGGPDAPSSAPGAGRAVRVTGRWQAGRARPWLRASAVFPVDERRRGWAEAGWARTGWAETAWAEAAWGIVRWRDGLVDRIDRLFGAHGPLVAALVLARREGLDPALRERFAVTGIAHLLAISGFHVGVVAGILFAALRAGGMTRRRAGLAAAGAAWVYVGVIGFPDAACRAALILTLVALSHRRGRPPSRWGALAGAALVLLVLDPSRLAAPGFQLSFAGAAGLIAWSRPLTNAAMRRLGRRAPRGLVSGVTAGVAATVATLPIVAWHFERVSVVGIPVTLAATPLVTLALPGALAAVALDVVTPAGAAFLAGGVRVALDALLWIAGCAAAWPWASAWTSRATVVAALGGVAVARHVARRPGIGARGRRALTAAYVATGVVAWPLAVALGERGALELLVVDVGQGDAIALRTPRGRWLLVDAGPPTDGDPRGHPVVRAMRARGVRRLEAMVLTHADADHFGGGEAVLSAFEVRRILDPVLPAPKPAYAALLAAAGAAEVPWSKARAGDALEMDGVRVTVLHPSEAQVDSAAQVARRTGLVDANDLSVVLLVRWRGFSALLTGDAYVDVERALADRIGDVDVLKVGHHGSDTSTDPLFLAAVSPELALISVGRRNRYGHPKAVVLERLDDVGATVHRTDQEGSISLRVTGDGRIRVRTERGGGG